MSAFESSYESLLQGVSQQGSANRQAGQVQAQLNMQSDPVTGPRRRGGVEHYWTLDLPDVWGADLRMHYAELDGIPTHIIVDCITGRVWYMDNPTKGNPRQKFVGTFPYLITTDSSTLRFTSVQERVYILNTRMKPTLVTPPTEAEDSAMLGAFRVQAGAFDTEYSIEIEVRNPDGSMKDNWPVTRTYITPKATAQDAAEHSSPRYVAEQLRSHVDSIVGIDAVREDGSSTVFFNAKGTGGASMTVRSSTGYQLMQASASRHYASTGELPSGLPVDADGWKVAVGSPSAPQYYRWSYMQSAWIEDSAAGSPSEITGVPICLHRDGGGDLQAGATSWPGRPAGDDTTNPAHRWMLEGCTGIGTFQGRLVLLSGNNVSLSSSKDVTRFWRSTVTSIVDDDPIEVGASSDNAAAYEHCLPYMHDLLLFSNTHQALMPSNNQAITPRTAMVVPTGQYSMELTSPPMQVGRTVMAPLRRSEQTFGVLEILPSPMSDQQYLSVDVTQHIPSYLPGRCRFSAASSVAGTAFFNPTGDPTTLRVHEYYWDGDEKLQQAWSTWEFPYIVQQAYFVRDSVFLAFLNNDVLLIGRLDVRGRPAAGEDYRPFLDMHVRVDIHNRRVQIPQKFREFDPAIRNKVQLAIADGPRAGDSVGFDPDPDDQYGLILKRGFVGGTCILGIPYKSLLSPSQVVLRDSRDQVISTSKLTVLRYVIGTSGSSEFKVEVQDHAGGFDTQQGTLLWSSKELDLDRHRKAGQSYATVPARVRADTSELSIYTEGTGELNITSLEYVARYNQKIRRR